MTVWRRIAMTAYNVVRYRVKAGMEKDFLAAHARMKDAVPKGLRKGSLIKTGERAYCFVGEWDAMGSIAAARAQMIAILDTMRAMLEDLGSGLGVTDPVSGDAVVEF